MSVKLLHVADVHLGAPMANFGAYAEQRRREVEASFRRAIEVAIERQVDAVLIAGDLFDSQRPGTDVLNLVRNGLSTLRQRGIRTIAVPGTHDRLMHGDDVYARAELPLDHLFRSPTFESPFVFDVRGTSVAVYGIAYDPEHTGRGWDSLRPDTSHDVRIVLAHAACRDNPEWSIPDEDLPFEADTLAALDVDYIALGHYHNLRWFQDEERTLAAYSGSLEGRNWKETGPRHVVLVEWSAGRIGAEAIEVHTRTLENTEVDISGLRDRVELVGTIERLCQPDSIWRIELSGSPDTVPDVAALTAELQPRFGWVEIDDRTTLVTSQLIERLCQEETIRGAFFRRLVEARDEATEERACLVADRAIKLGVEVFG